MPKPYVPGEMSRQYFRLTPPERTAMNKEVDLLFRKRTGIARRLDPKSLADREPLREWLRIRDEVMASRSGRGGTALAVATAIAAPVSPEDKAHALVAAFEARTTSPAFLAISRAEVATGLYERLADRGKINQSQVGVCPSASVLYIEARDHPVAYAQFVIDLYEKGQGTVGTWTVKAGADLKRYAPPAGSIHVADWIPMASIRDSENWFFDFQDIGGGWSEWLGGLDPWSGGARTGEMGKWLKKAGYTKVIQKDNLVFTKGKENLVEASKLRDEGYKIILAIDADVLSLNNTGAVDETIRWKGKPNHVVVLTSPVTITGPPGKEVVNFTIFTWGEEKRSITPDTATQMLLSVYLRHHYGFLAAKY